MTLSKAKNVTEITSIMILLVVSASLSSLFFEPKDADAALCQSPRCYVYTYMYGTGGIKGDIDNNAGNPVKDGYGITNPFWVDLGGGDWLEIGWQKGNFYPCVDDTASHYYYTKIDSTVVSGCMSYISGTSDSYEISDTNGDDTWKLYFNGSLKLTIDTTQSYGTSEAGGESTHQDNSLDNGKDSSLKYYTGLSWTNWNNDGVSDNSSYYQYNEPSSTTFEFEDQ